MFWGRHFRCFALTLTALAALSLLACAAASFDGRVYHDGDLYFRVGQIPTAWRPIQVDDALLAFRDDAANASIALNGRCKVDGDDVPLVSLTQHLFLQFTERTNLSQSRVPLAGREALRTEISAALDGVTKQYLVYVLKKDGCVYDFMYISAESTPASRAQFERFVQSFGTIE
jgi:hypothetical protein